MTLQELIDTECNRVLEEVCARLQVKKSLVQSRSINPRFVMARRDTVQALFASGFRKADIARTLKCHHGTVKYWIDDDTRDKRREYCSEYYASGRRGNVNLRNTEANAAATKGASDRNAQVTHCA